MSELGARFEVEVERAAYGGEVIARAPDGRVLFLRGPAPGDRVEAEVTAVEPRLLRGRVVRVVSRGRARVEPFCPVADRCGGCPWQGISGEVQRDTLERHVRRTLEQAAPGGFEWQPIVPAEPATAWRSTARVQVEGTRLGYFEAGSQAHLAVERCPVLAEPLPALWTHAAAMAERAQIEGAGVLRLTGAAGATTGTLTLEPGPTARHWRRWAELLPGGPCHGVRLREPPLALGTPEDRLGPYEVPHPAGSFVQAHQPGNAALVAEALRWLAPGAGQAVLELYAGSGNFTFALLAAGARVTAVETDPDAASRLRAEAERRGLPLQVVSGDATRWPGRFEAVLMDPPRAGARPVLASLARMRPSRLVYVSCEPATLARDVRALVQAGASLVRARPFELFPHTGHVETLALLMWPPNHTRRA